MKKLVFYIIIVNVLFGMQIQEAINLFNKLKKNNSLDKNSLQKILKVFEKKCKNEQNIKACYYAGYIYQNETVYFDKALKFYKMACKKNYALACRNIGFIYYNTYWTNKKYKKEQGIPFYKKACELNDGFSCVQLGLIYKDDSLYKHPDLKKAMYYFKKAFNLDANYSAINIGNIYKLMYNKTQNKEFKNKALKYYKYSCEHFKNLYSCDLYKELKNFPPKILGLTIGEQNEKNFLKMCKNYNCIILNEGYPIIGHNNKLFNKNLYIYKVKGLPIQNLKEADFYFYKHKLVEVKYYINKPFYYKYIVKIFKEKYGTPYEEKLFFTFWKQHNYVIYIQRTLNNELYISYFDKNLIDKINKENEKILTEYIKSNSSF